MHKHLKGCCIVALGNKTFGINPILKTWWASIADVDTDADTCHVH